MNAIFMVAGMVMAHSLNETICSLESLFSGSTVHYRGREVWEMFGCIFSI